MRDFLELVKSTPEIKRHILDHFKLENEIDKQLLKPKLSAHEIGELLELQTSLNEIENILSEKMTPQEKLIQIEIFLKQRWERIRQTSLSYPYEAHTPLTQLCHGLAKLLKHNAPETDKRCVLQFLMPSLKVTKYEGLEDEHLDTLKKFPTAFLDHIPLGCFILDDEDAYPIPLEILARNTEMKAVPGYFVWKKTKCVEYSKQCSLYNPYTGKVLTDGELHRLIHFTEEGQEVNAAADHYLEVVDLPGGSIRKYLTQLKDDLVKSSQRGQGNEEAAHGTAYEAIVKFQGFLNSLSVDRRDKLFDLLVDGIELENLGEEEDSDEDTKMTFRTIWENLTEFGEKNNGRICTDEQSKKLETLLHHHPNASFLDSDSEKISSLNSAHEKFEKCLEAFSRRCEHFDKKNIAHCTYETSKTNSLTLSLLSKLIQAPNFFNVTNPFKLYNFMQAIRNEIQNNLNKKTIHQQDLKTQLFLIDSAFRMGLTLTDDFIVSFFYKNPKWIIEENGNGFWKGQVKENIPEEIVDLFIKNNIKWNNILMKMHCSLLYYFIRDGQLNLVNKILKLDPLIIDSRDNSKRTIVYEAVVMEDPDVLAAVLKMGANPNVSCGSDYALNAALMRHCPEMIEALLSHGADVNLLDYNSCRSINYIWWINDINLIKEIIKKSTDLNHKDCTGLSPLAATSSCGALNHVKCLLENEQVNLESVNNAGLTALMLAAKANHIEVVKALLDAGADFWAEDSIGAQNAIQIAVQQKHWATVELMLEYMNIDNRDAQTHSDSMDMEVDVERADDSKQTKNSENSDDAEQSENVEDSENSDEFFAALMHVTQMGMPVYLFCEAVCHNQVSIAKKILSYSFIDFKLTINTVIRAGYPEMLSLLLQKETGIDLELPIPSEDGLSPLALAAKLNKKEMVIQLVQAGAKLDKEVGFCQTIRDWAIQHQYEDVCKCIDDQLLKLLLEAADKGGVENIKDLIRAYLNLDHTNAKIVTGILSKIGAVYTKNNITVTAEGIQSAICDENAYYSAEWINLICSKFKHAQIKMYLATTREQFKREYIDAINLQEENFAFIPLNVPFDKEADNLTLNHWQALIIDRQEMRIFIMDPASTTSTRLSAVPSNSNFVRDDPWLKQFQLDYLCLDLQSVEEKSGWIRHCGVYVIEIFRQFFEVISKTQAAVYIGSADFYQFVATIHLISSLPKDCTQRYFSTIFSKIIDKNIRTFLSFDTFKNIPHLTLQDPLMLRQRQNKEVAEMMGVKVDGVSLPLDSALLMKAVYMGNIKIVKGLLDCGINPNAMIENKYPISVAIDLQNRDMVRVLLDKKANPNIFPAPIMLAASILDQGGLTYEQVENLLGIILDLADKGARFNESSFNSLGQETKNHINLYLNEKRAIKAEDFFIDAWLGADDLNLPQFDGADSLYTDSAPGSSFVFESFYASSFPSAFFKPQVTAEELLNGSSVSRKRPRDEPNDDKNTHTNGNSSSSASSSSHSNDSNLKGADENPSKKPRL